MKDQYVGDIGDFVKLALLRAISSGQRVGVVWWKTENDPKKKDGRFINYLKNDLRWRGLDPPLFDHLRRVVRAGYRSIAALEEPQLLPECRMFWSNPIPCPPGHPYERRRLERRRWFADALNALNLHDCDLVFLDPDNGIASPRCKATHRRATKYVFLDELCELRANGPNATIVVYHHNTRRFGGHGEEVASWLKQLAAEGWRPQALRARSHSPRTFFLLNATMGVSARTLAFASKWRDHGVELFK
jgi:hypothetical protein